MRLTITLSLTILFCLTGFIAESAPDISIDDLQGVYEYTAAEAPAEYQKGIIELKKVNKEWKASIKVNGQTFEGQEVKVEDGNFQFRVYIEGSSVTLKLTQKDKMLSGTASTNDRVLNITAKKKDKK